VLEYGTLEAGVDGTLVVALPESFRHERRYLDAAIVLSAAVPIVLEALASKDKTPVAEQLPDVDVLGGGGLASCVRDQARRE
jgi:hypothetical protein